ncbi:aspartoacylase [Alteromonas oceanisediminis]|uniref:aspartoacylase n=1 Tax=Alteromonas oceanisediminis TaxID=2836180 RepID=UPI001BDA24DB|nr:aspartoacylase [Alteromonas oceanisediminis]MBT0585536.1 aspartoacylase [Alteromonas oceanisediminis]
MKQVNSVLLVGGTHGNELTGVRLVEQWSTLAESMQLHGLFLDTLMANPTAVAQRVRFVEQDLNRQFAQHTLAQNRHADQLSIEASRAQELALHYSADQNTRPDVIIDIHNTTSNMGATLILVENDEFNRTMARFVKHKLPQCNVLLEDEKAVSEHPYLCTLGRHGVMLEMGAQPQGVCRASLFHDTLTLLQIVLDFCHAWGRDDLSALPPCDVFRFVENIEFPLTASGQVAAMIHPALQDADFIELSPGKPIFTGFDGTLHYWQGSMSVYPHFINEAAYQAGHVAFATAVKAQL